MIGDLFDKVNVLRVVVGHLKTLTAGFDDEGQVRWRHVRPYDVLLFYVIPGGVGAFGWRSGWELSDLTAVVASLTFLAGILLTLLFQTLTLAERATEHVDAERGPSWERERARRRMVIVRRSYHSLAYAFLVSVVLLGAAVVLQVPRSEPSPPVGPGWTAALAGLGLHLGLTLLLILNRVYLVIHRDVRDEAERLP